jgi:hypothetical protein
MTCHKCLHLGPEFYKVSLFRTKAIQIRLLFKDSRVKSNVVEFEKLSNFRFGHFFIWVLNQPKILFYRQALAVFCIYA